MQSPEQNKQDNRPPIERALDILEEKIKETRRTTDTKTKVVHSPHTQEQPINERKEQE